MYPTQKSCKMQSKHQKIIKEDMKRTLFLTIVFNFLYTVHADIYWPSHTQPYKDIIIFFDLDKVVLDEIGGLSKVWAALMVVPLKKSVPILLRQRKELAKLVKESRYDGQKLKGLKANLDCILEAEPKLRPYRAKLIDRLNEVAPRKAMIRFLNVLRLAGSPLIIATNNDYESLHIKIYKLNKKLRKKHISSFIYDAAFCAGSCPELIENKRSYDVPVDFVYGGKDTDAYFVRLFEFVEIELGYKKNETLFIYIDDLYKNIERARRIAEENNVQLFAVHRNKSDKKTIEEMRTLFRAIPLKKFAGL